MRDRSSVSPTVPPSPSPSGRPSPCLSFCCTHSGSGPGRGKALCLGAPTSATAPDHHDTYPLSAFSVMWYVSPVKKGCCQCSPPVVAASSLPSSCHPQSPRCIAQAPTSWRSLLQPHYLSGERQAWGEVGSRQGRIGRHRFLFTAGTGEAVEEAAWQTCPWALLAWGSEQPKRPKQ